MNPPDRSAATRSPFLDALQRPGPLRAVELRPPAADLKRAESVEAWIDLERGVRRLLSDGRFVLFTDDAVGDREEESLRVLTHGLGSDADLSRVVPFLTCKHSLEYCRLFARRARASGLGGITVTGGDRTVGPPRCLPRSRDLRARLAAAEHSRLPMGAWVNPYRDPLRQVELLMSRGHYTDYWLTQVVSHHDMEPVDRFLAAADRLGLETPGLFGVFHYRSARPSTLERLARFLPVPVDALTEEFASGATPAHVCSRTLEALARRGIRKVYVSNLEVSGAARVLSRLDPMNDPGRASPRGLQA